MSAIPWSAKTSETHQGRSSKMITNVRSEPLGEPAAHQERPTICAAMRPVCPIGSPKISTPLRFALPVTLISRQSYSGAPGLSMMWPNRLRHAMGRALLSDRGAALLIPLYRIASLTEKETSSLEGKLRRFAHSPTAVVQPCVASVACDRSCRCQLHGDLAIRNGGDRCR